MELTGKTVIITGATHGLGKALVLEFLGRASNVIASSNQVPKKGIITESRAIFIKADVRKQRQVENLANAALKKYKQIDIWVNNAGIWMPHSPAEEMDLNRVRQMVEVNLFGVINGCRSALKAMRKTGRGIIVNILSTSALEGRPGSSGYCASKYAAVGFTKSLRQELADDGLTVIGIYPAGMKTELFGYAKPDDYDSFMDPMIVAQKIVENLTLNKPIEELIIRRPGM